MVSQSIAFLLQRYLYCEKVSGTQCSRRAVVRLRRTRGSWNIPKHSPHSPDLGGGAAPPHPGIVEYPKASPALARSRRWYGSAAPGSEGWCGPMRCAHWPTPSLRAGERRRREPAMVLAVRHVLKHFEAKRDYQEGNITA